MKKTVLRNRTGRTRGLLLWRNAKPRCGFELGPMIISYLLSACVWVAACSSPVLEVTPSGTLEEEGKGEEDKGEDGGLYDGFISHTSFVLDAVTGLPAEDAETNEAGKAVATLTVPETEGPWTPELDAEIEDNGLFELVPPEEEGTYVIQIKSDGGPLPVGPYKAVLRIRNEAGKVFHRTCEFAVARTPPPFKKAPAVHPYITGLYPVR
jgi:hypothetical protein